MSIRLRKSPLNGCLLLRRCCLLPKQLLALMTLWLVGSLHSLCPADEPNAKPSMASVRKFLNTFCIDCHGEDEQHAERRFDTLDLELSTSADSNQLADLQDILDQLNLGQMPPEDADLPSEEERRQTTQFLSQQIAGYHASRESKSTWPLRRRNNREYRNALRDLLDINMLMFDPVAGFPRDTTTEHLDNIAGRMVTSSFLLDKYLDAANASIEKILRLQSKPTSQSWRFNKNFRQQPEIDQVHKKTNGFQWLTLYDVIGADKHEGAYAPLHEFAEGVPADGFYEIEFLAEAVNRDHPYDDEFLSRDKSEPLRLGIRPGNKRTGPLHKPQPIEPLLAEFDLADEMRRYKTRVWLDAGYTPRFTFRNGLMDARNLWSKLIRRYPDGFAKNLNGIVAYRFNAIKFGKLPQIHIHEIKIKGPFYDQWPTRPQEALFGEHCESLLSSGDFDSQQDLQRRLETFAARAFRRPITQSQLAELLSLYASRRNAGRTPTQAYGDVAKRILVAPSFLFLAAPVAVDRPTPNAPGSPPHPAPLIADRLAAFLWSSVPDQQLQEALAAAPDTTKARTRVLRAQVDRMLGDAKSISFDSSFLDAWLNLRDLGASPPDRSQFRAYYQFDLQAASLEESRLYFRHLIDEDLPPKLLLDSDFTFVNKRLAAHYGLPFDGPNQFRRVQLPDRRRGGLLGHASVLTVSANGIETSPVVRGIWVLESILASPPNPPPPDVPPLDPDTRGARTIREQLAKHRSSAACNDCHRKIDPPGFALENFDPVGRWRDRYSKQVPIDAAGELSGGRKFDGVMQFKEHLLADRELFYRGLVHKLMSYAHGRLMRASDRPQIDAIVYAIEHDAIGLREVIHRVAQTLAP